MLGFLMIRSGSGTIRPSVRASNFICDGAGCSSTGANREKGSGRDMGIVILSILILFSVTCAAVPVDVFADGALAKGVAQWSDTVHIDGNKLLIRAVSRSGDAFEDDMDITILQDDRMIAVPVRKALYEPAKVLTDQKSYSEVLPVFKIGPNEILLVLTENGRPNYPYTTLVVFDYLTRKVMDVKERIAKFKQENFHTWYAFVSAGPDRYRIRLIKENLGLSDGPESYIEAWMTIRYVGGKLECQWQ